MKFLKKNLTFKMGEENTILYNSTFVFIMQHASQMKLWYICNTLEYLNTVKENVLCYLQIIFTT